MNKVTLAEFSSHNSAIVLSHHVFQYTMRVSEITSSTSILKLMGSERDNS
jgi:hypothetical protein